MSRTTRPIHLAFSLVALCYGCGGGVDTLTGASAAVLGGDGSVAEAGRKTAATTTVSCPLAGAQCRFERGITTCTRTVSQETVTGAHDEISGCMSFDGVTSRPGRRTRHFEDVLLVTTTETTLARGMCGDPYQSTTEQQQQIQSSQLVSDVCEAI